MYGELAEWRAAANGARLCDGHVWHLQCTGNATQWRVRAHLRVKAGSVSHVIAIQVKFESTDISRTGASATGGVVAVAGGRVVFGTHTSASKDVLLNLSSCVLHIGGQSGDLEQKRCGGEGEGEGWCEVPRKWVRVLCWE